MNIKQTTPETDSKLRQVGILAYECYMRYWGATGMLIFVYLKL